MTEINDIGFAMVRVGAKRFVGTFIKPSDLATAVQKMNVEMLPTPLEDIRILWPNQGKKNFTLRLNETNREITGDAGFFQFKNGEYCSLSGEAYKRICDAKIVMFD